MSTANNSRLSGQHCLFVISKKTNNKDFNDILFLRSGQRHRRVTGRPVGLIKWDLACLSLITR